MSGTTVHFLTALFTALSLAPLLWVGNSESPKTDITLLVVSGIALLGTFLWRGWIAKNQNSQNDQEDERSQS